jgi:cytochrome c oxidase accessory protein FixG
MQGVLLDRKSIVVSYDYKRGEPRGAHAEGDCIDCRQCIAVCPTAIDIRNGTQLECINCAACIDECNGIMKKVKKPVNLIRYASAEGIEHGHSSIWNWRNRAYTGVLLLLFCLFIYTLTTRSLVEATILRTPGLIFQENNDGTLSNVYNIKIVNKTHENRELQLRLLEPSYGVIKLAGNKIAVADQGLYESTFVLFFPALKIMNTKTKVQFGIFEGHRMIDKTETTFVGPDKSMAK